MFDRGFVSSSSSPLFHVYNETYCRSFEGVLISVYNYQCSSVVRMEVLTSLKHLTKLPVRNLGYGIHSFFYRCNLRS